MASCPGNSPKSFVKSPSSRTAKLRLLRVLARTVVNWRAIFGLDLSGKLAAWKRRYRGDWVVFDYRTVWCHVTAWNNGTYSVSASVSCSDVYVQHAGNPFALIYNVGPFASRVEADAVVEREIRKATRRHRDTSFYRYLPQFAEPHSRSGKNLGEIAEYCLDGT